MSTITETDFGAADVFNLPTAAFCLTGTSIKGSDHSEAKEKSALIESSLVSELNKSIQSYFPGSIVSFVFTFTHTRKVSWKKTQQDSWMGTVGNVSGKGHKWDIWNAPFKIAVEICRILLIACSPYRGQQGTTKERFTHGAFVDEQGRHFFGLLVTS